MSAPGAPAGGAPNAPVRTVAFSVAAPRAADVAALSDDEDAAADRAAEKAARSRLRAALSSAEVEEDAYDAENASSSSSRVASAAPALALSVGARGGAGAAGVAEDSDSAPSPVAQQRGGKRDKESESEDDYVDDKKSKMPKIVETSPTGRYVRFNVMLGEGAFKKVYRAYDTTQGVEVAWNAVKVAGMPPAARQRVVQEMKILQTLDHGSIIHFYSSFLNKETESVVFITEMMASGTLKEFIQNRPVRLRILKRWCRHILHALVYLHEEHNPPIIHRDLKCDNIFINGSTGDIRIGDLGLASWQRTGAARSVLGTPEYMAPEMFDENYDEQVDIYAFGMCVLEMITKETPYMECSNMAQIYKKVVAGQTPDCFNRLKDCAAKEFVYTCVRMRGPGERRPSASELRKHSFLVKRENDPEDNLDCQDLLNPAVPPTKKRSEQGSFASKADEEAGGEEEEEEEQPRAQPPPTLVVQLSQQQQQQEVARTPSPHIPLSPTRENDEAGAPPAAPPRSPSAQGSRAEEPPSTVKLLPTGREHVTAQAALSPGALGNEQVLEFPGNMGTPTRPVVPGASGGQHEGAPAVKLAKSAPPIPPAAAAPKSSGLTLEGQNQIPASYAAAAAAQETEVMAARVSFGVGTPIEARFGGGEGWFKGRITAIAEDRRLTIKYDDQDYETGVDPSLVRIIGEGGYVYNLGDVLRRSQHAALEASHVVAQPLAAQPPKQSLPQEQLQPAPMPLQPQQPQQPPQPQTQQQQQPQQQPQQPQQLQQQQQPQPSARVAQLLENMQRSTSSTGSVTSSMSTAGTAYWRISAAGPNEGQASNVLNIQFTLRNMVNKTKQTAQFELHLGKDRASQLASELAQEMNLASTEGDSIAQHLVSFGQDYQAHLARKAAAGEGAATVETFRVAAEQVGPPLAQQSSTALEDVAQQLAPQQQQQQQQQQQPPAETRVKAVDDFDRLMNEEKVKYERMHAEHHKKIDEINRLKEERKRAPVVSGAETPPMAETGDAAASALGRVTASESGAGSEADLGAADDAEAKKAKREAAERKLREEKELIRQRKMKEAKEAEDKLFALDNILSLKEEEAAGSKGAKTTLKEQMQKRIVSDYTTKQATADAVAAASATAATQAALPPRQAAAGPVVPGAVQGTVLGHSSQGSATPPTQPHLPPPPH